MPEIRHSVCALDCPDCCSLLVTVEDGRGHEAARQSGAPGDARVSLRQGGAVPRARILAGPAALSAAAHRAPRAKGGSSASPGTRRWTRSPRGCRRSPPSSAPRRSCLIATRHHGLLNGGGMDRPLLPPAGRVAAGPHHLLVRRDGAGMTEALGVRYATEPEQFRHSQADPRLGREHSRHQRPPVAVHHGGAAQRREAVHHRPAPQSHRRGLATGTTSSIRAAIRRWRSP